MVKSHAVHKFISTRKDVTNQEGSSSICQENNGKELAGYTTKYLL